jgi:single-strand DNA-binding protein
MSMIAGIHGRVARDGELRESKSGKPWCRVSVVCEAGADRKSGEALTQWVTVVAFGRQAEELAKVEKGQTLSAVGRVELNRWTRKDGQEHEGLNLIATVFLLLRQSVVPLLARWQPTVDSNLPWTTLYPNLAHVSHTFFQ